MVTMVMVTMDMMMMVVATAVVIVVTMTYCHFGALACCQPCVSTLCARPRRILSSTPRRGLARAPHVVGQEPQPQPEARLRRGQAEVRFLVTQAPTCWL